MTKEDEIILTNSTFDTPLGTNLASFVTSKKGNDVLNLFEQKNQNFSYVKYERVKHLFMYHYLTTSTMLLKILIIKHLVIIII